MKSIRYFLPAAFIAVGGGIWFIRANAEADDLRHEVQSRREAAANPPTAARHPKIEATSSDDDAATLARKISAFRAELKSEEEAASDAEKRTGEIRAKLPAAKPDEAIVSYGRITDMGSEAGQSFRHVLGDRKGKKIEGKDGEELGASFMKIMAWTPEIAGFEESPGEIASFEANMLREIFEFDEAKTRQAEAIMRKNFEVMKAAGLTAANASAPHWKERRSEVLTQLLWQLRPLLPPDFNDPGLAALINIGAGFETDGKTEVSEQTGKGRSTVTMALPSWPRLPWAPAGK